MPSPAEELPYVNVALPRNSLTKGARVPLNAATHEYEATEKVRGMGGGKVVPVGCGGPRFIAECDDVDEARSTLIGKGKPESRIKMELIAASEQIRNAFYAAVGIVLGIDNVGVPRSTLEEMIQSERVRDGVLNTVQNAMDRMDEPIGPYFGSKSGAVTLRQADIASFPGKTLRKSVRVEEGDDVVIAGRKNVKFAETVKYTEGEKAWLRHLVLEEDGICLLPRLGDLPWNDEERFPSGAKTTRLSRKATIVDCEKESLVATATPDEVDRLKKGIIPCACLNGWKFVGRTGKDPSPTSPYYMESGMPPLGPWIRAWMTEHMKDPRSSGLRTDDAGKVAQRVVMPIVKKMLGLGVQGPGRESLIRALWADEADELLEWIRNPKDTDMPPGHDLKMFNDQVRGFCETVGRLVIDILKKTCPETALVSTRTVPINRGTAKERNIEVPTAVYVRIPSDPEPKYIPQSLLHPEQHIVREESGFDDEFDDCDGDDVLVPSHDELPVAS